MNDNPNFPTPVSYLGPRPDDTPVRTGRPTAAAGVIHPCDPAAVARLHALLGTAERRAAKAALTGRAAYDHGDIVVNHQRRINQRRGRRAKRLTDEHLCGAVQRRRAGESWASIAADLGVSPTTLAKRIRAAGHNSGRPTEAK